MQDTHTYINIFVLVIHTDVYCQNVNQAQLLDVVKWMTSYLHSSRPSISQRNPCPLTFLSYKNSWIGGLWGSTSVKCLVGLVVSSSLLSRSLRMQNLVVVNTEQKQQLGEQEEKEGKNARWFIDFLSSGITRTNMIDKRFCPQEE